MATDPVPTRSGFWSILIAVIVIVVIGAWWFIASGEDDDGVDLDTEPRTQLEPAAGDTASAPGLVPEPLPGTPAATGTAGEPSGISGASPHPGNPVQE